MPPIDCATMSGVPSARSSISSRTAPTSDVERVPARIGRLVRHTVAGKVDRDDASTRRGERREPVAPHVDRGAPPVHEQHGGRGWRRPIPRPAATDRPKASPSRRECPAGRRERSPRAGAVLGASPVRAAARSAVPRRRQTISIGRPARRAISPSRKVKSVHRASPSSTRLERIRGPHEGVRAPRNRVHSLVGMPHPLAVAVLEEPLEQLAPVLVAPQEAEPRHQLEPVQRERDVGIDRIPVRQQVAEHEMRHRTPACPPISWIASCRGCGLREMRVQRVHLTVMLRTEQWHVREHHHGIERWRSAPRPPACAGCPGG